MTVVNPCYALNLTDMYVAKDYSAFLKQFNWDYFITCRTPYKIYTMTVRNWINKLYKRSVKVDNVFFCFRERQRRLQQSTRSYAP